MRYTIVIQLADHVIVMYKYVWELLHFADYLVSYEFDNLTNCYTGLLFKILLYKALLYKVLLYCIIESEVKLTLR